MEVLVVFLGLGFAGLWVAALVFWIVKLVEVAKIPDHQFKAGGTDKIVWVLVVALVGWIGALIWHFGFRERVLAAAGMVPGPPPGWYPEPTTGAARYWDGAQWTPNVHNPPPPLR